MDIDMVIKELEEMKKKYGNIEVELVDEDTDYAGVIWDIWYDGDSICIGYNYSI